MKTAVPTILFCCDLPTPDFVIVRGDDRIIMVVDPRVPQGDVDDAIANLDTILAGPAYTLSAA